MWKLLLAVAFFPLLVVTDDVHNNDLYVRPDVIADVMDYLQWKDAILVYDGSLSPQQGQALRTVLADHQVGTITLQLSTSHSDVIASLTSAIQSTTMTSIILCVDPSVSVTFLKQAKEANLLNHKYQWLVIGAGMEPQTLADLLCCTHRDNIALVFPVIDSSPVVKGDLHQRTLGCSALNLTAAVLTELKSGIKNALMRQQNESDPAEMVSAETIRLDQFGVCSYNWQTATFNQVAAWTPESGLDVFGGAIFPDVFQRFNNVTLRIGAWEAIPFSKRLSDNGTLYTGFCFAILDEMARYLNFTYDVVEPGDGQYGAPEKNGTWNGMVGMLISGELDMAVGPFTITPLRSSVVDFTVPFMKDGGGILTKGGDPGPDLLNVFRPFPLGVWLMMGVAVLVTSAILLAITRVGNLDVFRVSQNQKLWTLEECMMAIFGSLMLQGVSDHPASSAGRLVLGCWWLFTILIVSIYTASLAALLTVHIQGLTIDSIDDLAASSLDPVTIIGTNWWTLFTKADSGVYGEIGKRMASAPLARINDDALELVHAGTAAFILDVNQVSYLHGRDCKNLHMAKTIFNSNGLGFALPKNAYYKEAMNKIILKLQEGGFLEVWKQRWWQVSADCKSDGPTVSSAKQLPVVSIGGILILYGIVIALALFCLALQWLFHTPCLSGWRQRWFSWVRRCGGGGDDGGDDKAVNNNGDRAEDNTSDMVVVDSDGFRANI